MGSPQVEQLAWKPRQFLQVGEACTAVVNGGNPQDRAKSPPHWLNFSLYRWGNFILHTERLQPSN
ncbi:MAG: hypothetical protein ACHBN1_20580 [Heteroscytonema crispum UTEX LB 1556]